MSHNYSIGWSIVRAPLVMSWLGFGGRVIERDGLREEETNPGQDATAECHKMTDDDDVADEDGKSKDEKYATVEMTYHQTEERRSTARD